MVEIRLKKRYRKRKKAEETSGIRRSQKRARKKAEVFFPDDLIIDILRRLPAENAIRCRLVCRRWRDLTSTHSFKELHMRSSIPMILVATERAVSSSFLLDKWWDPERRRLVYHRFLVESKVTGCNDYFGKFSHGGLVVFAGIGSSEVIILNPTSHKNVQITLSKELQDSEMYGVFFNPTLEEYCTLWKLYLGGKAYYKMLNLGFNPCWRDISNPWSSRIKDETTNPVLIGAYLYWLVIPLVMPEKRYPCTCRGDIMEFDIISEKFDMMPCPVPLDVMFSCCSNVAHDINLLDIDGVLSFVLTSRMDVMAVNVTIWKLKDRKQKLWLPVNHIIRVEERLGYTVPATTLVVGDQLVLWSDDCYYVCNLELGTIRTLLKEDFYSVLTTSHVMSLASLKHCKSKIFMNIEGELGEESYMA